MAKLVSATYGDALFSLALEENKVDAFYEEVTALYRLDQLSASKDSRMELGPMPAESKTLLITLGVVWIGIGVYYGSILVKKRRKA